MSTRFLTGLIAFAIVAGMGFVFVRDLQIRADLAQLQQENSRITAQLATLEAKARENASSQQDQLAFRTAAESALRHLLMAEAVRSAPTSQRLLHHVQADDSTTNSPFAILSEHFATKAYVDQQVASLQNQLASTGKGKLVCRWSWVPSSGLYQDQQGWVQTSMPKSRPVGYAGQDGIHCRIE